MVALLLLTIVLLNFEALLQSDDDPDIVAIGTYIGLVTITLSGISLWVYIVWSIRIMRWQQEKYEAGGSGLYVCEQCGYDLRGTLGPVCPECGAKVPEGLRVAQMRQAVTDSPEPWQET